MREVDMSELPPEIDTSRPHAARIYDYFLGGYFLHTHTAH
jgi:S-adenosyl methyltransferase